MKNWELDDSKIFFSVGNWTKVITILGRSSATELQPQPKENVFKWEVIIGFIALYFWIIAPWKNLIWP
jgi:hypothetical protein